ncbi:MAG: ABC transporter permease subunit [Chloroflexi bacterium]|nr:ABC transporter permease subunit [Chloroflexota bacterium]
MANQDETNVTNKGRGQITAWLFDERFLQVLAQVIFASVVLLVAFLLYQNMARALAKQGMVLGFNFLRLTSGFDISFKLIDQTRESSNLRVIQVGILNTILVAAISIVLSTVLGVIVGIMRVSRNFLVNRIAWLYIEIFRNVPLLLVIIASYAVFIYNLPLVKQAFILPGPSYLSNRGLNIPSLVPTGTTNTYLILLLICLVAAIFVARLIVKRFRLDNLIGSLIALAIFLVLGAVIWFAMPAAAFLVEVPIKKGLNYTGGITLPPEFIGIIVGLVMGSSPFTADTVRAGLQSVSKGQIEAAHALGLSGYQTMRLVIIPQAMRVIVPPMTSNYLSLTKNSSLASAIAFPEIVHITSTITSQTGRAVEIMTIVMAIYATLSLLTSLFMNWYNNRIRIVER